MAECERLEGCPFFHDRMARLPFAAEQLKQRFCLGSNDGCSRYMVFSTLGKEHVPSDLFPNDVSRAERIIADARFERDYGGDEAEDVPAAEKPLGGRD